MQEKLDNALTSGQNVAQVVRQILEGIKNQRMYHFLKVGHLATWCICWFKGYPHWGASLCVYMYVPSECQSESAESVRKTVFQHCIEQLNKDRLQSQMAKELVGKLLIEVCT